MRLLPAALVAPLLAVPVAQAAPRPAPVVFCHMVVDSTGDATALVLGQRSPRNDDAMDFRELDLATNGTSIVVVARMLALNPTDFMSPTGRLFTFSFVVNKKATHSMRVLIGPDGKASTDTGGTPVVDNTPTVFELRTTAPLAAFSLTKLTTRDRFTSLRATSERWAGDLKNGQAVGDKPVDVAEGDIPPRVPPGYPHKAKSCVVPGR